MLCMEVELIFFIMHHRVVLARDYAQTGFELFRSFCRFMVSAAAAVAAVDVADLITNYFISSTQLLPQNDVPMNPKLQCLKRSYYTKDCICLCHLFFVLKY